MVAQDIGGLRTGKLFGYTVYGRRDQSMRHVNLLFISSLLVFTAALPAESPRFNRDIRPILSENCFACHGPDKNTRQAGLRLDQRDVALAKGAIKPGDIEGSKMVARIRSDQEALRMPPVWSDKKLTAEQKQTLVEWVRQGAEYEGHWAYLPPERSEAPGSAEAIDFFIGKGLAGKGLAPVDEADRRIVARRLSFDLTGMPPEPALVDAFEKDRDPRAYEKLLDRLLASPRFGEAHGGPLARFGSLCRHGRVPWRRGGQRVPLSRLRHSVFQRKQAVRRVHARTKSAVT